MAFVDHHGDPRTAGATSGAAQPGDTTTDRCPEAAVRRAADGRLYTWPEFVRWYGSSAEELWRRAPVEEETSGAVRTEDTHLGEAPPAIGGASQPTADEGADESPRVPDDSQRGELPDPATHAGRALVFGPADRAPAAAPRATTAFGAGVVGDVVLGPANGYWVLTPFLRETLPAQRLPPHHRRYGTLRDAMNGAYDELYEFLPLNVSSFVTFDPAALLNEHGATVVAEKINQVFDTNRPPKQRVDFICYRPSGMVVRHHPGHGGNDATLHEMPWGCSCFARAHASVGGVGNALHQVPPKYAELLNAGALQPGDPLPELAGELLTTRAYMNELSKYDVNMVSTRFLLSKLEAHSDADHTESWTNGWLDHFPWWVWLANTGRLREASNNGVSGATLHVANHQKWWL